MQLNDLPTDHGPLGGQEPTRPPSPKRGGGGRWALLIAALLVAAAGAVVLLRSKAPEPVAAAPVAAPPVLPTEDEGDAAPPVPAAEADDAARTTLTPLSSEPEWSAWLSEKDLLRRLVGAVNAVADGDSPRASVPFLAPKTPFAVRELEDGSVVVDPASWERYEPLARVIRGLEVERAVEAFASVSPLLEQFHREGARPGDRFQSALERALDRVIALPLPDEGTTLVPAPVGAAWIYEDPRLEALPAAEKHLLRLGPGILEALQEKARALRSALERY